MPRRRVFLNYRRGDTPADTGRLRDWLSSPLRCCKPFMDVANISSGIDYVQKLREEVANCEVLLAVIGEKWLDVRDEQGLRRLDNPNDPVRVEIAAALERGIPVIPILIDETEIPPAELLPADIADLSVHNAFHLRHASFEADFRKLYADIKLLVRDVRRKAREAKIVAAAKTGMAPEQYPDALWLWVLGSFGGAAIGASAYVGIASLQLANTPSESRLLAAVLTSLLAAAILAAAMWRAARGNRTLLSWPMLPAATVIGLLSEAVGLLGYVSLASGSAGKYLPDEADVKLGLLWLLLPLLFFLIRFKYRNGPSFWRYLFG